VRHDVCGAIMYWRVVAALPVTANESANALPLGGRFAGLTRSDVVYASGNDLPLTLTAGRWRHQDVLRGDTSLGFGD
jgi:hypothetical protein